MTGRIGLGSLRQGSRHLAMGVLAGFVLVVAVPATASAMTLYVSESPKPPGTSCKSAGFKEVQSAIDEAEVMPGSTVVLCGGTYKEQLQITGEISLVGKSKAKVELPATIKDSTTACDGAINALGGQPNQDLVSVCTPGTVKITSLNLEARWPRNTCYDSMYNTIVGGGGTLEATKDVFQYAGVDSESPDIGCQGGVGVQVGFSGSEGTPSLTTPAVEVGHATLTADSIRNYQKNGITVDGEGSTATIGGPLTAKVTVTGDGPVHQGQNGVQVSRGATALIDNALIRGNECNIPSVCGSSNASQWEEDAAGVLLYLPGSSTTVEGSTISENNINVEYISGSETRPATPELTLKKNKILVSYADVQINQGNAALEANKLTEAKFALDVNENEFGGAFGTPSAYAPDIASKGDYLSGSTDSVRVEPSVGELTGELTLTSDSLVGPIVNPDPHFTIVG